MTEKPRHVWPLLVMIAILGLVGAGLYMQYSRDWVLHHWSLPDGETVMGTPVFHITMVLTPEQTNQTADLIAGARAAADGVDERMSTYRPESELSRLNAAPADVPVPLSAETIAVLTDASVLYEQTDGAFDVTLGPVIRLWRSAGQRLEADTEHAGHMTVLPGHMPTDAQVRAARAASHWDYFVIADRHVVKSVASAGIDLGGIAKGYGIDRAVQSLIDQGVSAGIVDIGGDIRCFGAKPQDKPWTVGVTDPFWRSGSDKPRGTLCTLAVRDRAVATSGNYERYQVIDGQRLSHIIDPRTGRPCDLYPSVTVIAPLATTADAWATALSVLGPGGLERLAGKDIEAMIISGDAEHWTWTATPGFEDYVATPMPPEHRAEPAP